MVEELYCPAKQLLQFALAAPVDIFPLAQFEQPTVAEPVYWPGPHDVHAVQEVPAENFPASQLIQLKKKTIVERKEKSV